MYAYFIPRTFVGIFANALDCVCLISGFKMMNIVIYFDTKIETADDMVKKIKRVLCVEYTIVVFDFVMFIVWTII